MARLLINHGLGNLRYPDHWQRHLAAEARNAGHVVAYPQFPSPEKPATADWQSLLVAEAQILNDLDSGELLFVGHSLGSLNFLYAVQTGVLPVVFDRVLLVAPADPTLLPDLEIERLNPEGLNWRAFAKSLQIVASDGDQWIPRGIQATFGEALGVEPVIIPGAKHLSLADGWGHWQGVIDWVDNPAADLTKR